MAGASLIASAIGIILLIVTSYVLVGGSIGTTEMMLSAQTDMTSVHTRILATSIDVLDLASGGSNLLVTMRNSGSEAILDLEHLDVYVLDEAGTFTYFTGANVSRNVSHILNPGEEMALSVPYTTNGTLTVRVVTANGAPGVMRKTV